MAPSAVEPPETLDAETTGAGAVTVAGPASVPQATNRTKTPVQAEILLVMLIIWPSVSERSLPSERNFRPSGASLGVGTRRLWADCDDRRLSLPEVLIHPLRFKVPKANFLCEKIDISLQQSRLGLSLALSEPSARFRRHFVLSVLSVAFLAGEAPKVRAPAPCKSAYRSPLSDHNCRWPGKAVWFQSACPDRIGRCRLAHPRRPCAW